MKLRRLLLIALVTVQLVAAGIVVSYCATTGAKEIQTNLWLTLMFVAGGVTATAIPISIIHAGSKAQFSAMVMFIVAAALALPTRPATLAVGAGSVLGWMVARDIQLTRVQDSAADFVCVFFAIAVAHAIGGPGLQLRDILGAIAAAVVYDPLSLLFIVLTYWLTKSIKFWQFVWDCIGPVLPTYPFLIACGILIGALAVGNPWTLPLTAAPLALIFLASNARVEATEDRGRLDGLLTATTAILECTTIVAVIDSATSAAAKILEARGCRVDTEKAREGELGAPIHVEQFGNLNLIAGSREAILAKYTEHDQRLLETLASVTSSALEKAFQHEATTVQASRDALTGLVNRRSFEEQVRQALLSRRSNDGSGIIFADLDGFKKVNDVHGHNAGDEVLVQTAARLAGSVRGRDVVARLGGDEFTILLRGVHTEEDAILVAERVLTAMRRPIVLSSGVEVQTTPSVGIALALEPGTDPAALLQAADAAMYEAKRAGKDRWSIAAGSVVDDAGVPVAAAIERT